MTTTAFTLSTFRLLGGLVGGAWIFFLSTQISLGQAGSAAKSVNDGVYSAAQADRGEAVFKTTCASCHETSRFTGAELLSVWAGKPLFELFDTVSKTMPEDKPGSLKPQQYADVITFFLKLNGYPAGQDELKGTPEAMKAVTLDKKGR